MPDDVYIHISSGFRASRQDQMDAYETEDLKDRGLSPEEAFEKDLKEGHFKLY